MIQVVRVALIALLLCSCGKAKPEPAPVDPPQTVVDQWHGAEDRLLAGGFAPDGFVVSITADATFVDQGDSLIWTGTALASMDCARGAKLDQALQSMVATLNGGLWRHPSQPDQVSLDGALGFYLGVAHRITHCGEAEAWKPLLAMHQAIAPALNPRSGIKLDQPFWADRDAVFSLVGLADYPDSGKLATLGEAAAAAAAAPGLAHRTGIGSDACFRANLGLFALQVIEATGGSIPSAGRNGFCSGTDGYGLATSDHFCGRGDLRDWLDGFKPDVYQYAHQRCQAYESPDGQASGAKYQPGVDDLRGFKDAYALQF